MRAKKLKRKRNATSLQYTAITRTRGCEEVIRQRAEEKNIEVFFKGHAKNRLYFRCSPERWIRFKKNISDLCFFELPVPLPNHIRRSIVKNLQKATINKFDLERAHTARRILAEITTVQDVNTSRPVDRTRLAKPSADNTEPTVNTVKQQSSSKLKRLMQGLKKHVDRVPLFKKQKGNLRMACS